MRNKQRLIDECSPTRSTSPRILPRAAPPPACCSTGAAASCRSHAEAAWPSFSSTPQVASLETKSSPLKWGEEISNTRIQQKYPVIYLMFFCSPQETSTTWEREKRCMCLLGEVLFWKVRWCFLFDKLTWTFVPPWQKICDAFALQANALVSWEWDGETEADRCWDDGR